MKRQILTVSALVACTLVQVQSQTETFLSSNNSISLSESANLSAAPTQAWVARYKGPGNADDVARAIAIDSAGNVYVTGYNTGSNGFRNYATIKYNNAGIKQWVASYNGPGNNHDVALALAIDAAGNVYVTGYSYGLSGTTDYATIKYNNAGVRQWVARYNGPASASDTSVAIKIDGSGNVYVAGHSTGKKGFPGGYLDYVTIKYNNAGVRQWVASYDGSGNSTDGAKALAVDDSENVYVTGYSTSSNGYRDYATVKYNNAGIQQWVTQYNGPGNKDDLAYALKVDSSVNVYVTGHSTRSNGNWDYATIKYNNAGVQQWVARYNGPANSHDGANAIAVDGSGNVYVTGYSTGSNGTKDYVTIKYLASSASVASSEAINSESNDESEINTNKTLPTAFSLAQNFPNPFNPATMIRFDMPTAGRAKLTIYNLAGELVRTLVDGEMAAGYHQVAFDGSYLASGIYFYRLEAGGAFIATQKMVLQK
jgi:hypothetical protein